MQFGVVVLHLLFPLLQLSGQGFADVEAVLRAPGLHDVVEHDADLSVACVLDHSRPVLVAKLRLQRVADRLCQLRGGHQRRRGQRVHRRLDRRLLLSHLRGLADDGGDELGFDVLEFGVGPVVGGQKRGERVVQGVAEVSFGQMDALQLAHRRVPPLPLLTFAIEQLVLLGQLGHLFVDLRFPVLLLGLASLVELAFVGVDGLDLGRFIDLETGLFQGLAGEDVEDGLDLAIEVEEVVVEDLGAHVHAFLLREIRGRRRSRQDGIRLDVLNVHGGRLDVLLGQEVREVDFDLGGRGRTQVVRSLLGLVALEGDQLFLEQINFPAVSLALDRVLRHFERRPELLGGFLVGSVWAELGLVLHDSWLCSELVRGHLAALLAFYIYLVLMHI